MSIRLHRKHGLAPTIPICFFCGKEKNEIALLGAAWRGTEEPPKSMCVDHSPCEECANYMKQGIILVSVRNPKREFFCEGCNKRWTAVVRFSAPGEIVNISGEKTEFCPKCGKQATSAGPHISEDNKDPHRTGGWAVVTEEAIIRLFGEDHPAIKVRFCFIEDHIWDTIGLPRK